MADDSKMPWYSYLILIFHVGWSAGILFMTHRDVVPQGLRWGITLPWLALVLVFGIIDKVSEDHSDIDSKPVDRWTIVHTLAGVVFGLWFVPFIYVLILVFLWECFEFSVAGFGDQEVVMNRVVDMGVAMAGWLVVVLIFMAIKSAPFPLA